MLIGTISRHCSVAVYNIHYDKNNYMGSRKHTQQLSDQDRIRADGNYIIHHWILAMTYRKYKNLICGFCLKLIVTNRGESFGHRIGSLLQLQK